MPTSTTRSRFSRRLVHVGGSHLAGRLPPPPSPGRSMSFAARFAGRPSLGARAAPRRSRPVASSSRVHAPRGRAARGSSDKTTRAVADESRHRARAHLASGAFARPVRAPPRPFATRGAVSTTAEHAEPGASADPPVPSRTPPGGDDDDDDPGASLQSRDDDDARDPSPRRPRRARLTTASPRFLRPRLPPPSTAASASSPSPGPSRAAAPSSSSPRSSPWPFPPRRCFSLRC